MTVWSCFQVIQTDCHILHNLLSSHGLRDNQKFDFLLQYYKNTNWILYVKNYIAGCLAIAMENFERVVDGNGEVIVDEDELGNEIFYVYRELGRCFILFLE